MPNIGFFHPQIVHFVIAGAGLGLFFRWVSLTGKFKWTDGAAVFLIVLGTVAAWASVQSGTDAHGVTERIPGAVRAVQVHEAEGIELRNLLSVIAALELILLVPALAKWRKYGLIGTAALGVWAAFNIYETGKLGGELVYSFAGGIGTRSGDSTDINRLVMAATYDRAMLSRTQKNYAGAAAGFAELAAKFPQDQTVQIMAAESMITDKKDFAGATLALAKMGPPPDTARTYNRYQIARANAYLGAGKKDSAKLVLEPLAAKMPTNRRIQDLLEKAK